MFPLFNPGLGRAAGELFQFLGKEAANEGWPPKLERSEVELQYGRLMTAGIVLFLVAVVLFPVGVMLFVAFLLAGGCPSGLNDLGAAALDNLGAPRR